MTLKEKRGRERQAAILRMAMEGMLPALIAKQNRMHPESIRRCILVGEKAGVLQRIPGTKHPIVYEPGPNASMLLSGWPSGPSAALHVQGGGPKPKPMRVHSVNYRVQVLGRPAPGAPDLPWKPAKPWGRCPQWTYAFHLDEVGTVRLRLIGSKTMAVFTPSFRADRADCERMLDVLRLRVQAVLSHLTRTYSYRFGPIRLHTRPEWAFPVDNDGIKRLLARCKPKTKKWWADASPESGGAEVETGEYEEAVKYLEMPDRLSRLENLTGKHGKGIAEIRTSLERVVTIAERQQRNADDLKELVDLQLSRLTYMVKELGDKLDRKQQGLKEN